MNFDKLKESARKYEQSGDWRRAIEVYQKAIQEFESGNDPAADLSIYNRVGDLYLKANDPSHAVQAYERAADLYREQGFYNNAIALCGKILRVNPGRSQTYLRLAHLNAHKNVVTETKKNLLEYLDRMNGANQLDEAFKSLKDFAEHFPGNKDLRLMLSDLLRASSRDDEAKEQLEKLASDLEARGDSVGARKTLQKLHAIESAGPLASPPPQPQSSKGDLVFLDTGMEPAGAGRARAAGRRATVRLTPPALEPPAAAKAPAPPADEPEPLRIESASLAAEKLRLDSAHPISEEALLEATSLDVGKTLGFEPTIEEGTDLAGVTPVEGLELDSQNAAGLDLTPVEGLQVDEIDTTGLDIEHSPSLAGHQIPGLSAELADGEIEPAQAEPEAIELVESLDVMDSDLNLDLTGLPGAPAPEDMTDLGLDLIIEEEAGPVVPAPAAAPVAPAAAVPAGPPPEPTIAELEERVFDDPEDPDNHRTLGEALIASGDTDRGLEELDLALTAYETREQWERATDLVNELILLEPSAVRHYQKLVELAYLTGDRGRLVGAYLELGDALMRVGALDKALAVYSRVAEHDPDNSRARLALETLAPVESEPEPEPAPAPAPAPKAQAAPPPAAPAPPPAPSKAAPPPAPQPTPKAAAPVTPAPVISSPPAAPAAPAAPATRGSGSRERPPADAGADFIDLGALILDEQGPRDTRMKVESEEQSGDEQRDFQEMLQQFKRGIDANIDAEDFQSHYDLGVAFKEMGLLDEAIAEFQKALRAPEGRLRTTEALGVAFYDKGQFAISEAILKRAVESLGASDDEQIGLIYWMGRAAEAQEKSAVAISSYERVMAVDIGFQDTRSRMKKLAGKRA
jgi:tetratricopeptide (TPR) repeat protein